MLIADDKMDARALISRQSTQSIGGEARITPSCGNCLEVIHDLYQKLEPQITKSYRPNVKYIPGNDPGPKHISICHDKVMDDRSKKMKQIKTAKIVIDAVSELQKRKDSNISVRKKFSDIVRRASVQDASDNLLKGASQSLPDLSEKEKT